MNHMIPSIQVSDYTPFYLLVIYYGALNILISVLKFLIFYKIERSFK